MSTTTPTPETSASRLRTDTLATSVVLLMLVTIVQRSVGFGRGILFCRWLSPETLGEWEMALSFLLFAAPLVVLGVPGSFGRYLEHYRQRGHLQTFLKRSALWTMLWSSLGVLTVFAFAPEISRMLFGVSDRIFIVWGIGLCLAGVILNHSLASLLTALRLIRVLSVVNFSQSLLFALLALGLLLTDASVGSILAGYGAACVLASVGGILWILPALKEIEHPIEKLSQTEFWPKLLRFAFFVWVTNLLTHLFAIVDRYMIVHFSGLSPTAALDQVGHYHSSRIVPLLLVAVADLLSGLIMPHLSRDWEAGNQPLVSRNTNLSIKLTGLVMLGAGIGILVFAPFLFDIVLEGKYSDGLEVLPWTLTGCVWFAIYLVTQNYMWCAERARLATLPLALGLVANIGLNLVLLPMWGLLGAVVATGISTAICLIALLLLSRKFGMATNLGTWVVVLAPLSLTGSIAVASILWCLLVVASIKTDWLLDAAEREQLRQATLELLAKVRPYFQRHSRKAVQA